MARLLARWSVVAALVGFVGALAPAAVSAAFVNGTEHFAGTTFDLSTWSGAYTAGTVFQWNNGLHFDNRTIPGGQNGGRGELFTNDPIVGVGQWVEAKVEVTAATEISPEVSLRLSTKTNANNSNLDSWLIETALSPYGLKTIGATESQYGTGYGYSVAGPQPNMLGTSYILRIDRPSSTLATFSAFDENHNPVGAPVSLPLDGCPDNLHVVLYTGESAAQFDYVTIGTLPEPTTFFAGFAPLWFFMLRRGKR